MTYRNSTHRYPYSNREKDYHRTAYAPQDRYSNDDRDGHISSNAHSYRYGNQNRFGTREWQASYDPFEIRNANGYPNSRDNRHAGYPEYCGDRSNHNTYGNEYNYHRNRRNYNNSGYEAGGNLRYRGNWIGNYGSRNYERRLRNRSFYYNNDDTDHYDERLGIRNQNHPSGYRGNRNW